MLHAGGGKYAGIWPILKGFGTIHPDIRVVDMGLDAPYGPYPWGLPPQGGP